MQRVPRRGRQRGKSSGEKSRSPRGRRRRRQGQGEEEEEHKQPQGQQQRVRDRKRLERLVRKELSKPMDGSDVVLDSGDEALQAGRAKVARLRRLLKRVSVEATREEEGGKEKEEKEKEKEKESASATAPPTSETIT